MRWEQLFADLEARLEAEERAAAEGDLADLVRAEHGQLTVRDRLGAHIGATLTWSVGSAEPSVTGELLDLGADWMLVRTVRREVLVPIAAVGSIAGLSRAAVPVKGEVARRLGLAVVLRGLARDRAVVTVRLRDEQSVTGTIDRVGADHLDLALHAAELPRRSGAVLGVRCLMFQAIISVAVH
jgi:hypothetical protein